VAFTKAALSAGVSNDTTRIVTPLCSNAPAWSRKLRPSAVQPGVIAFGKNHNTYVLPARSCDDTLAPLWSVSVQAGNGSPVLSSAAASAAGPWARGRARIRSRERLGRFLRWPAHGQKPP